MDVDVAVGGGVDEGAFIDCVAINQVVRRQEAGVYEVKDKRQECDTYG
jgi:hypothetical protein